MELEFVDKIKRLIKKDRNSLIAASNASNPYRPLDGPNGLSVAGRRLVLENLADRVHDLGLEVLLVDQHKHRNHDLADEDDEQHAGIGHGHAVGLANGAAAAEEGDQEDDASEHDQDDRSECGIIFSERPLQVARVGQGDRADCDQGNAAQLYMEKRRDGNSCLVL